jgi:glyoxylase-like metal-dependent hydrolase (beta-lactamase superfamily II)
MRQITPDIYLIEGMIANVFLLVAPGGLILLDSGQPGHTGSVTEQLQAGGFAVRDVRSLVLTHAHSDHAGGAAAVAAASGCQVQAHEAEVPYLETTASLPLQSAGARLLMWAEERVLPRSKPCHVDLALHGGDTIAGSGGYVVVHTPGHTPGSICLYHPDKGLLFCGDALFNRNPLTGQNGLRYPLPLVCSDVAMSRQSVRLISDLQVNSLLCGHGDPILENAGELIHQMLWANREP